MSSGDVQDMPRATRRSLRTIQSTATDTENLVGKPSNSPKHQLSRESPVLDIAPPVKRKSPSHKKVQANLDDKVSVDDLTNPKTASKNYWKALATKSQAALQEALSQNEKLHETIEELKEEIVKLREMLEEANAFVEVVKDLTNNTNDDTGIDVNDVSQADSLDDTQKTEDGNEQTSL
ncbi:Geminin [Papilio machaon]|uniref:Geminin n=1 Tax=Papilio machaon TaxID=76193 RepID=A0A0N1IIN1_PAPMA|nr:geminin [Papilio machaon]KPJ20133.1 Geminin [Papilio machaon]